MQNRFLAQQHNTMDPRAMERANNMLDQQEQKQELRKTPTQKPAEDDGMDFDDA